MHLDLVAAVRQALADRYEIGGELGRGGMAVVCQATDRRYARDVAIKVLYPDLAKAVGGERFLREISILARLSHPNILPLLDSGSFELVTGLAVPWYVMPLIREETLRNRLTREGPLPVEVALRYTGEICAALAHAHAQGFIHRDIKPENILLQGGQAVLADFGIARAVTVAGGTTLTSTGLVVGTPAYMSPEQSIGGERLDPRSDLYSLGVVLYEMLAGHPPFTGATPQAISARHQFEPPPPVTVVRPGLPAGVPAAVDRALAKVAADRFQSAEEFAEALRHPHDTSRSGVTLARRPARWWRPVAVALLVIGLAWALAPRLSGGVRLDPRRFAVLPFELKVRSGVSPIDGDGVQIGVVDALSHWEDLGVVGTQTIENALTISPGPMTLARALAVARKVGAGRLIWGTISQVGDSVLLQGAVYDASNGKELRTRPVRISPEEGSIGVISERLTRLAWDLALPREATPANAAELLGAKSLDAFLVYQRGDSALNHWNLPLARRYYREALQLDQDFPNANLKLALVGHWLGESVESWKPYAERAAAARERLVKANRLTAEGLIRLGAKDPAACESFRQLIALDSLDFRGWYGLGACLLDDDRVEQDSTSPSGYRFRSSYGRGIDALSRALMVVPASHLAFGGAALQQLASRLMTESNIVRYGRSADSIPFAAFPELLDDTLAFIPWPAVQGASGQRSSASWFAAIQFNRERLLRITGSWLDQFPDSRVAIASQATALEAARRIDGPGENAIALVRRLRSSPEGATDAALATREVRLLLKSRRFSAARALAESVLAVTPREEEAGISHAGVAALIGRANRAADLLGDWYHWPMSDSRGLLVALPSMVRRDAQRLLVYAAFGGPGDSLRVIAMRIRSAVASQVPHRDQPDVLDAALFQASLLAFPDNSYRTSGAYTWVVVEGLISRGQVDSARALLDSIQAARREPSRIVGAPEIAVLEARLWLRLGDSGKAARRLDQLLSSPQEWDPEILSSPAQAASIGRAMHLRLALPAPAATGLDTAVIALWGNQR